MPNKYFSNWGQVVQVVCILICTPIAIWNAFPDLKKNDLFTPGAFLAYLLVVLFVGTVVHLGKILLHHRGEITKAKPEANFQAKYEEAIRSSSVWENRCDEAKKQLEQMQQRLTEAERKFTKTPERTLTIHSAQWIPKEHVTCLDFLYQT